MRRELWLAIAVLCAVLAAMAAKSLLISVPPVRAQAAAGQFDTQRAFARLQRVLGDERPHPTDTDANDAVRARLIAELNAIGLRPVVRRADRLQLVQRRRGGDLRPGPQRHRADRPRDRQGAAAQRPLRRHPGRPRRVRRRHRRRDFARGGRDPQGPAAQAPDHLPVQRGRGARPARRPRLPRRPAQPQRRCRAQLRGARRHRAGDDVRDQPAQRALPSPCSRTRSTGPSPAAWPPTSTSCSPTTPTSACSRIAAGSRSTSRWSATRPATTAPATRWRRSTGARCSIWATRRWPPRRGSPTARRGPGGSRIFVDVLGRFLVQMPLIVGLVIFGLALVGSAVVAVRRGAGGANGRLCRPRHPRRQLCWRGWRRGS